MDTPFLKSDWIKNMDLVCISSIKILSIILCQLKYGKGLQNVMTNEHFSNFKRKNNYELWYMLFVIRMSNISA